MTQWEPVLDQLVRTRRAALVGYACLLTSDRAEAERLTSRALVQAFATGRGTADVVAAEVVVRRAIRRPHIDSRRLTLVGGRGFRAASTSASTSAGQTPDTGAALARLDRLDRLCVVMAHVDRLELADIAAELRLTDAVVRRHLADGAAALRETLGDLVTIPADQHTVPVTTLRTAPTGSPVRSGARSTTPPTTTAATAAPATATTRSFR